MESPQGPGKPTMTFEIWPILLLVEGPVNRIGQLLLDLYDDARAGRGSWTVDHTMRSRKTYAEHLRRSGLAHRRQGIGTKYQSIVTVIQEHCARLQLDCHTFGKSR